MPRLTITEYAALSVQLAHASAAQTSPSARTSIARPVARVLADASLTADEWDAETLHWESALSDALDHEDEVPQLVLDYSMAIQAAQNALAGAPLALEIFSQILGEVQRGALLDPILRQHHLTLPEFLSAQRHWMMLAASDPEVRLALEAALR